MRVNALTNFLIALAVVTIAGTAWHVSAVRFFSRQSGGVERGMIANPRAIDYNVYDYQLHGRYYERWAFMVPATCTTLMLVVIGGLGAVRLFRQGRSRKAAVLVVFAIGSILLVLLITLYNYVIAVNAFI